MVILDVYYVYKGNTVPSYVMLKLCAVIYEWKKPTIFSHHYCCFPAYMCCGRAVGGVMIIYGCSVFSLFILDQEKDSWNDAINHRSIVSCCIKV